MTEPIQFSPGGKDSWSYCHRVRKQEVGRENITVEVAEQSVVNQRHEESL